MSITVADCLKLPALQEAAVIGGSNGLNKIVTAVSVLEYSEVSVLKKDLFIGNELLITAFVSVKDNVEKQCEVLRRLGEVGVVALVLYYVGIFVPKVDDKLIKTADELNLPLIIMPKNRFDYRYGEVISEVLETIFKDQSKETYFVPSMLDRISQLPERHCTISSVLRMLSDRLRYSLLLADKNMNPVAEASWPMGIQWNCNEIIGAYKTNITYTPEENTFRYNHEGSDVFVAHASILLKKQSNMHLFAIASNEKPKESLMAQAAELIHLYMNFWKNSFSIQSADEIIKAILTDEPLLMRLIAKEMHINTKSIHTMWVLKERNKTDENDLKQRNIRRTLLAKLFLQQSHKLVLADTYEDDVILFMDDLPYAELESGIIEDFFESLNEPRQELVLACFSGLNDTREASEVYLMLQECWNTIGIIYPNLSVIGRNELFFAKRCKDIMENERSLAAQYMKPLEMLKSRDKSGDLIKTLCVFLLDAGGNMQETGKLMYLHKNTIKYRICTIKETIGSDITKMPGYYDLYLAAALSRLQSELSL